MSNKIYSKYVKVNKTVIIPLFLLIFGIVMGGIGVFAIKSDKKISEYTPVDATIVKIETYTDADDNITGDTYVEYSVDGKKYSATLGYSEGYDEGGTVRLYCNPDNPEDYIQETGKMAYFILGAGVILILIAIISCLKNAKKFRKIAKQDKEFENGDYKAPDESPDSVTYQSGTQKDYYYHPSEKLNHGGYMDDANRMKVCEVIIEKANFLKSSKAIFKNYITGLSEEHTVGSLISNSGLMVTDSSFSFDRKNVWDYLYDKGIRIDLEKGSGFLDFHYNISLCGKPYAVITHSLKNENSSVVSEEKEGLLKKIQQLSNKDLKITCYSDDLDLLLVTAFTISKLEQNG